MDRKEKLMDWLKSSMEQDNNDVLKYKNDIVKDIKKLKKEDIIPIPQKLSLWKRILKVLNF